MRELHAGEFGALVSVEDFRHAVPDSGFLHGLEAEIGGPRDKQSLVSWEYKWCGQQGPDWIAWSPFAAKDTDILSEIREFDGLMFTFCDGHHAIGACVPLVLAGGLLSVHFAVRPLRKFTSTIDGFRENHFIDGLIDRKMPAASGDEIDAVSSTFYCLAGQIQTQMRDIAQADWRRHEFIANVSHDLRTPLASIQWYLNTLSLKNESLMQQERQQYQQIALTQAKSLSYLVSTLVYLGQRNSGQIELQPEMFRIDVVVHDVVQ